METINQIIDDILQTKLNIPRNTYAYKLHSPFSYGKVSDYICIKKSKIIAEENFRQILIMRDKIDASQSPNVVYEISEKVHLISCIFVGSNCGMDRNMVFLFKDKNDVDNFTHSFSKELLSLYDDNDKNHLDKIFLPKDLMDDIIEDFDSFMSSEELYRKELKLPWKRGYMFIGPPGNGKTLLIRQLAKQYGLHVTDISNYITNKGTLAIAEEAREQGIENILFPQKRKPTVFVMEDIDKFATMQSGSGDHADAGSISLHAVLKGLDGVEENDGAIIMATTNYAEQIAEPIMNRPGRFDRVWTIELPKMEEKIRFLNYHNIVIEDASLEDTISKLGSCSMAYVEELVKSLKKVHKRSTFKAAEVHVIIDRINKHQSAYKNHFSSPKEKLGFNR